jgi:carbonic anhydrase
VCDQVFNVCNTTIIQDAWRRGQKIIVHGWIYDLGDGLLKDLGVCVSSLKELRLLQE